MRAAALGLVGLLPGTFLGGCDAWWEAYIKNYDMSPATDQAAANQAVADLAGWPDSMSPAPPLCDPSDSTLVLCLTFEGQVADSSRNGLKLTPAGPPVVFVNGAVGQAAQFTTATGVYAVADATAFDVGDYTFETWVQPDSQPADPAGRMGLLDRDGAFSVFLYKDVMASANNAVVLACSVPGAMFAKALQIPLNTFSHIACTIGGTQATFYLNGELVLQQTITAPIKTSLREVANLGSNNPVGDDKLVGALDELRFFARVRTAAEIKAAYQHGKPP